MRKFKIDLKRWNADRLKVEAEIRALKHSIRKGGERMGLVWERHPEISSRGGYVLKLVKFESGKGQEYDYKVLRELKNRATYLYTIRAMTTSHRHNGVEVFSGGEYELEERVVPAPTVLPAE